MITRRRLPCASWAGLGMVLASVLTGAPTNGQATKPTIAASTTEQVILDALRADPLTAPYAFTVVRRQGRFSLSGTVGSRAIHDAAIRTLINLGIPFRDDLRIDTAEGFRSAVGPIIPPLQAIYPPPIQGRVDEPFLGFEPPLVSFPPWWGTLTAREAITRLPDPQVAADALPSGSIAVNVDVSGVVTLRGEIASEAERETVLKKIGRVPGVTQVVDLLRVVDARGEDRETPPPPPQPANPVGAEPLRAIPAPPLPLDSVDPLAAKVNQAIARRPALASLPIQVTSDRGIIRLSGRVPSAYEAMLAFRVAQQTPGVKDVEDRLSFDPPAAQEANPLKAKARSEDLEPYLLAQVRRQVGDLAHIDRIEVQGDQLEVHGTVSQRDEVARAEAALRTIPLLRGFRLEPHFVVD